ncbi:MAG: CO dehydrogenase/acetyl-CoA synthase complex subunit alpha [Candidatus Syntropharchaeia archaeon]
MKEKALNAKLKFLRVPSLTLSDLEVSIGETIEAEEKMLEPVGPTPKPGIEDLRDWDKRLLKRYRPFYAPSCDLCCFCTYGKCDLTGDRKGACGIDVSGHQGKWQLLQCVIGTSTHLSHAKELVEWLIEKKGPDLPLFMGEKTPIEAPIIRTVTGIVPKKLGDLVEVIEYVESQIPHIVASIHTGQEGDYLDFESKTLHCGMLDSVSKEIADVAQICGLGLPQAEINPPLVEIGFGCVDIDKPVILCIGHNIAPGSEIVNYAQEKGVYEKLEVCALCCTAHDTTRYNDRAKIIGPMSKEVKFVRSGVADVIVVDEQCIRTDILQLAISVKSPLIATSTKAMHGLPDRTRDEPDKIVKDLVNGTPGVIILDPEKAGEVAVRVALEIAPKRQKFKAIPDVEEVISLAKKCQHCGACVHACPNSLPISEAMHSAARGDLSKLADLEDSCIGCGRCEGECKRDIPVLSMIATASEKKFKEEKYKIRCGRGAISDYEIRMVADSWGLGIIPGCIAIVGCANYPGAAREVYEMADEFLRRRYIVVATGCGAMDIGRYVDEDGKTLYEKYHGVFEAAGMLNIGSCVSNAHIIGAGIRLAANFARKILRGNFEEIADYNLCRVGAVGIAWGAMSQKAHSIATGCNRFGIPVIVGPHGSKYRRLYLGRKEEKHSVFDCRTGEERVQEFVPEHLLYCAETKEEAIVMAIKLCMRYNDIEDGRQSKLHQYIEASQKFFGKMPDDLHLYVRTEEDIPFAYKDEVMEILKEKGWKPTEIPWDRMRDVSTLPNNKLWTIEALKKGLKWYTV